MAASQVMGATNVTEAFINNQVEQYQKSMNEQLGSKANKPQGEVNRYGVLSLRHPQIVENREGQSQKNIVKSIKLNPRPQLLQGIVDISNVTLDGDNTAKYWLNFTDSLQISKSSADRDYTVVEVIYRVTQVITIGIPTSLGATNSTLANNTLTNNSVVSNITQLINNTVTEITKPITQTLTSLGYSRTVERTVTQDFTAYQTFAIPRQTSMTEEEVERLLIKPAKATVTYTLGPILLLTLIFSAIGSYSLQSLWDYINTLQLLSMVPLMNLSLPPNLAIFLNYISGPLSFNYLSATGFAQWLFKVPEDSEQPVWSSCFEEFGMDTNLSSVLLEDTVVYVAIIVVGMPFTFAIGKFFLVKRFKLMKKLVKKLKEVFFYGFIMRLFIENFFAIYISCVINMHMRTDETYADRTSQAFSFIMFFTLWGVVFWSSYKVYKNKDDPEKIEDKYGAYFDDLDLKKPKSLFYTPVYLLRRLVFATLALAIPETASWGPLFQLCISLILSTALYVYFIYKIHPFKESIQNKITLLNESAIFILSFLFLAFADPICEDPATQMAVGWVLVICINFICGLNMARAFYLWVKEMVKDLRDNCCKDKGKQLNRLESIQQQTEEEPSMHKGDIIETERGEEVEKGPTGNLSAQVEVSDKNHVEVIDLEDENQEWNIPEDPKEQRVVI
ncbi:hypothetical protein FGO68_gene4387 [Halteria grandinella]|uniref:TRP C-terminal domain-containing protein n=1 Tax=Halteria grandinella TaxID=5974 RepID=A0A8J8NUX5_HALGN|nr:hypothetical protein FGO68_gene4387 [Halteria grandinella]